MRVAVFGGNGFLGKNIVRSCLAAGHNVVSISRSAQTAVGSANFESVRADVFDPASYRDVLKGADAVVHSMGAVMANPKYKEAVNQNLSPCGLVNFAKIAVEAPNPLDNSSLMRMNYESTVTIINELTALNRETKTPFVYISAENWNKLASPDYIGSKRRAEHELLICPNLRPVVLRPSFIAESSASNLSIKSCIAAGLQLYEQISSKSLSVPVEAVANAVTVSLDENISGVVDSEQIRALWQGYRS